MNRTWKLLCLPALLTLAVMVLPVRAADPPASDKPLTLEQRIEQLINQLKERDSKLTNAFDQLDKRLKDIEAELRLMEKRVENVEKTNGRQSNYPTETTAEQLRRLQESIDQLKNSRSSFTLAPEVITPTAPPPAVAVMGTVRVTNAEVFPCTVTINGTPYRVAPGQTVSVPVPAGAFTYEIVSDGFGFLRRNTLPVIANSTRDMTIQ